MAKYRENFHFTPRDIELIETALRSEQSRHALTILEDAAPTHTANAAREINHLLAKIFHQKVFYSQVKRTGFPGG